MTSQSTECPEDSRGQSDTALPSGCCSGSCRRSCDGKLMTIAQRQSLSDFPGRTPHRPAGQAPAAELFPNSCYMLCGCCMSPPPPPPGSSSSPAGLLFARLRLPEAEQRSAQTQRHQLQYANDGLLRRLGRAVASRALPRPGSRGAPGRGGGT